MARLVGPTVAAVLVLTLVVAPPASASGSWRAITELGPTEPSRVACSSSTCLAIANASIDFAGATGPWKVPYTVKGSGTSSTFFTDVACDGSLCVAVANSTGTLRGRRVTGPDAFVTTTGGRHWGGHALAKVRGATSTQVLDVACGSPTSCLAVGSYYGPTSSGGVAWSTDDAGATWSGPLLPSGVLSDPLACTGAPQCVMASGAIEVTTTGAGGFRAVTAPHPWGSRTSAFQSVACADRSACVVAGYATPSGQPCRSRSCLPVLLASPDGRHWSAVTLPRSLTGQLVQVGCASATRCVAVGDAPSSNPLGGTSLVVRGAIGSPWSALTLPRPATGQWIGASGVGRTTQGQCRTGDLYDRRDGQNFPYTMAGPA
ncbi:MAG: hypothetical protein B7Z69_05490 [Actinobacteria bacterium 21-73-9]|nr:MAG: hypothetical protein B7Z69_05490 [Actinobacteria bacterium 21-73-9]